MRKPTTTSFTFLSGGRSLQVFIMILVTMWVGAAILRSGDDSSPAQPPVAAELDSDAGDGQGVAAGTSTFDVSIRRPDPPRVDLGVLDGGGELMTASCSTCHSAGPIGGLGTDVDGGRTFHTGVKLAHGNLTCLACHNRSDYDTLSLADTTPIAYGDVMKLCGQCHGPQTRDYEHGAHGGMSGYWDLTRGPRARNNCVDCHDPHLPAFPKMRPQFKPIDRFLKKGAAHQQ